MLSWIFEQIASLSKPKLTPEQQVEAELRGIDRGPGEIAFEAALSASYAAKRDEKLRLAFTSAATPEAKTAVLLKWDQENIRAGTKKVEVKGIEYPPHEFAGMRCTGMVSFLLKAPGGTFTSIGYRTYV